MATKFFGQYLLEHRHINKHQLLEALAFQRANNPILGELAVEHGFLNSEQARKINQRQQAEDARFGDIAVAMKLITVEQLQQLISLQKQGRKFFGEILVELGHLSQQQLDEQLDIHSNEQAAAQAQIQSAIKKHGNTYNINALAGILCRLSQRSLATTAHFQGLSTLQESTPTDSDLYLSSITIESVRDLTISIACSKEAMTEIACRLIKIPADEVDEELAWDASGEFLNLVAGYFAKETIPDDCSYKARPPVFSNDLGSLETIYENVTYLRIDTDIGSLIVCLSS
ncbi:chemotaxis protein CheX [Pseudoteredinibacter isoporae]|uniref:Chemotaxis phosphatase CheX-like domain-containing protein n=1 Tax=Pseudoteredinibacter isoporae TaxID=570281 RepID=A0A7X0MXI6_9GAMM|nr:chemotaxis protein CheX [Pseudoteredinibacter isoporae]MBB6523801.1 hypothetical protein [Pseudoteredinibacter isoporae]NHO89321.1 hypothetical protein [Pseudoteredinibacter isoporae]NIB22428.1 hypothetical protein [Pseudoteredinibacter isoporae]